MHTTTQRARAPCTCTGTPPRTSTGRGWRGDDVCTLEPSPVRPAGPVSSRAASPPGPALLLTAYAVFSSFFSLVIFGATYADVAQAAGHGDL